MITELSVDEFINALEGCSKEEKCGHCKLLKYCKLSVPEFYRIIAATLRNQQDERHRLEEMICDMAESIQEKNEKIVKIKEQMEDIYTAEQFQTDLNRKYGIDDAYGSKNIPEQIKEWAKLHPVKPKVTNCDKMLEIFGDEASGIVASNSWLKAEYKEPKKEKE